MKCVKCEQITQGLRVTHNSWPCLDCGWFNSPFRSFCSRCGMEFPYEDKEDECISTDEAKK